MFQVSKLKTVGRVAALLFLLVALMGPWFADSHPSTEERCRPPLIWMGDGRCAGLESFLGSVKNTFAGQASLGMLSLPPALPFLSTLLLLLLGERRWLWVCHLTAWGFTALYALFFFFVGNMYTWGDGLAAVVAVATLVGEILIARRQVAGKHNVLLK
jgi:hypothetical protein